MRSSYALLLITLLASAVHAQELRVVWQRPLGARAAPPVTARPGELLVADGRGALLRLDATSGEILSSEELAGEVHALLAHGGLAYAITIDPASKTGRIHLYGGDGRQTRTVELDGQPAGRVAAGGDLLVVPLAGTDKERELVAFDLAQGAVRFRVRLMEATTGPAAFGPETLALPLADGRLHLLRIADGSARASVPLGGVMNVAPAFAGDRFIAGAPGQRLIAVDAASGRRRWAAEIGGGPATDILPLGDDALVATIGSQMVACRSGGSPRWRAPLPGRVLYPPALWRGNVLAAPHWRRELVGFDVTTGRPTLHAELPVELSTVASGPVAAGDQVVLLARRGQQRALVAFGLPVAVVPLAPAPGIDSGVPVDLLQPDAADSSADDSE